MLYWVSIYLMLAIIAAVFGFGTYRRPRRVHPEAPVLHRAVHPLTESPESGAL
jgi:hypothetical protein